jgi:hypothetical protein
MKKQITKLALKTENVRNLTGPELRYAVGGQWAESAFVRCPGTTDHSVLVFNCASDAATCTEGSGNSCPSVNRCGSTVD